MKWVIVYLLYMLGIGEEPDLHTMAFILFLNFTCYMFADSVLKRLYKKKAAELEEKHINFTYTLHIKDLL